MEDCPEYVTLSRHSQMDEMGQRDKFVHNQRHKTTGNQMILQSIWMHWGRNGK